MSKETRIISVKERMRNIRYWAIRSLGLIKKMRESATEDDFNKLEEALRQIEIYSDSMDLKATKVKRNGLYSEVIEGVISNNTLLATQISEIVVNEINKYFDGVME